MTSLLPSTTGAPAATRTSFGDQVLNSQSIPYMRSRNIEFTCKRLKPFTRVYSFFSGIDVNSYIIPKLLDITMTSGVFEVGETVIGSFDTPNILSPTIKFRVAQQNHKYGAYNSPSDVYTTNPYNSATTIPELYSSTSTILNVDTYSLSNQPQGQFNGYVAVGMKLRGQTSQAEATISSIRLVTDQIGVVIGSFFIPNGNIDVNPKFECGTKSFRVTSSNTNSQIFGTYSTSAEERYFSEGKLNTVQENVIIVRPLKIDSNNGNISGPGTPNNNVPSNDGGRGGGGVSYSSGSSSRTNVYYNYGSAPLGQGAVRDLTALASKAGVSTKNISTTMTAQQQANIVSKINSSSWASNSGVKVSTSTSGTYRSAAPAGRTVGGVTTGARR